jgi:hypothetical protein
MLTTDDLYPRDAAHRYRICAVVGDGKNQDVRVLAATPTAAGVGVALITLHEDAKQTGALLSDEGRIGVLDTMPGGEQHPTGEWIVLPWQRS